MYVYVRTRVRIVGMSYPNPATDRQETGTRTFKVRERHIHVCGVDVHVHEMFVQVERWKGTKPSLVCYNTKPSQVWGRGKPALHRSLILHLKRESRFPK